MRVLAFNVTHDSSVCSIKDGKIEFFCKEERLTRLKRDKSPFKSLELYKRKNLGKIDHILYCTPSNYNGSYNIFKEYIKKLFHLNMENFSSLTHHLCHASSAFYNSGFEKALTFVIDRNGSIFFNNNSEACRESETVFECSYPNNFSPIYKSFWTNPHVCTNKDDLKKTIEDNYSECEINIDNEYSIVKVYEAATVLIKQDILENGKTMGLSSYGKNHDYPSLFLKGNPIPNYFNNLINYDGEESVSCFKGEQNKITNDINKNNYQFYADKAKHVQLETQKEVLRLIKKYIEKTKINNVCIVGGYGLNVVANNFYLENLPNTNFYFEPVADDTGIAIGAAYYKYRDTTKDSKIIKPKNNFYHYYENNKINKGVKCTEEDICNLLIKQKSVAIFDSAPEAGPRALGHRSILFDPRNKHSKDIINEIKNREWYRPFAGVILKEKFKEYFKTFNLDESLNMTINFKCKNKTKELFLRLKNHEVELYKLYSDASIFNCLYISLKKVILSFSSFTSI